MIESFIWPTMSEIVSGSSLVWDQGRKTFTSTCYGDWNGHCLESCLL